MCMIKQFSNKISSSWATEYIDWFKYLTMEFYLSTTS